MHSLDNLVHILYSFELYIEIYCLTSHLNRLLDVIFVVLDLLLTSNMIERVEGPTPLSMVI